MSRVFPPCPEPAGNHPLGLTLPVPAEGTSGVLRLSRPSLRACRKGGNGDEEDAGLGTALLCCISTRGCKQPSNGGRGWEMPNANEMLKERC